MAKNRCQEGAAALAAPAKDRLLQEAAESQPRRERVIAAHLRKQPPQLLLHHVLHEVRVGHHHFLHAARLSLLSQHALLRARGTGKGGW